MWRVFLVLVSTRELLACSPPHPCAACGRCWEDQDQAIVGGCTEPCGGLPSPPPPAPPPVPNPPCPASHPCFACKQCWVDEVQAKSGECADPCSVAPPTPPRPAKKLKRLEPLKEQVINAVGQCGTSGWGFYGCEGALGYQQALPDALPLVIMAYIGITCDAQTVFDNLGMLQAEMQDKTKGYLRDGMQVGFQFGIWFANGGETAVAAGKYDGAINAMVRAFSDCAKFELFCRAPIWLRIGYEFNGEWNNYAPAQFITAFRRITNAFRKDRHTNKYVATVWDYSSDAKSDRLQYMQWYPGDEYVDWWGVNIFSNRFGHADPTNPNVLKFLAEAKQNGFPVMLGECTPRGYNVSTGSDVVDQWYRPYFDLIHNPSFSIRLASYINWDWSTTAQWPTWGDAQVQKNPVVLAAYRQEMLRQRKDGVPVWLHLQRKALLPSLLNLAGPREASVAVVV